MVAARPTDGVLGTTRAAIGSAAHAATALLGPEPTALLGEVVGNEPREPRGDHGNAAAEEGFAREVEPLAALQRGPADLPGARVGWTGRKLDLEDVLVRRDRKAERATGVVLKRGVRGGERDVL